MFAFGCFESKPDETEWKLLAVPLGLLPYPELYLRCLKAWDFLTIREG